MMVGGEGLVVAFLDVETTWLNGAKAFINYARIGVSSV